MDCIPESMLLLASGGKWDGSLDLTCEGCCAKSTSEATKSFVVKFDLSTCLGVTKNDTESKKVSHFLTRVIFCLMFTCG